MNSTPHCSQRGSVAVEFLLAAPAFLLVALFVIEAAQMWGDRHVARLAAFEAARALVSYTAEDIEQGANLDPHRSVCWDQSPEGQKRYERAKRAAVGKIAMISPTVTYFAVRMPWLAGAAASISGFERDLRQALGMQNLAIANALRQYVLALPTAWATTQLDCQEDGEAVTVNVRYYRAPKMPFVGGFLWALRVDRLIRAASGNSLTLTIDPLDHYGVKPDLDPTLAAARVDEVRTVLHDFIDTARDYTWPQSTSLPIRGLSGLNALDPIFNSGGVFDQALDGVIGSLPQLSGMLDNTAAATTALVYAVPESLRLIPMNVAARLVKQLPGTGREIQPWDGKALLIAPFNLNQPEDAWRRWAKRLQSGALGDATDAAPLGGS